MRLPSRLAVLLASIAASAVLASACAAEPTPTPTPTPEPTPTPQTVFVIDERTLGRDFIDGLPPEEAACVRGRLGDEAFAALLDRPVLTGGVDLAAFPIGCLGWQAALDLVVAGTAAETGGLSRDSETCIRTTFANVDIASFAESFTDTMGGEAMGPALIGDAVGLLVGFMLCLSEEEAAAFDLFGNEEGPSLQDLRCVLERVQITEIAALLENFAGGEGAPPSPGTLAALEACNINLFSMS